MNRKEFEVFCFITIWLQSYHNSDVNCVPNMLSSDTFFPEHNST